MKITIEKERKTEVQYKERKAREKAKELLKGKAFDKLTRAEKDEVLLELLKIHNLI